MQADWQVHPELSPQQTWPPVQSAMLAQDTAKDIEGQAEALAAQEAVIIPNPPNPPKPPSPPPALPVWVRQQVCPVEQLHMAAEASKPLPPLLLLDDVPEDVPPDELAPDDVPPLDA